MLCRAANGGVLRRKALCRDPSIWPTANITTLCRVGGRMRRGIRDDCSGSVKLYRPPAHLPQSGLNQNALGTAVTVKVHLRVTQKAGCLPSKITERNYQIKKLEKIQLAKKAKRWDEFPRDRGNSGSELGTIKDTLSAQLKKFCEIIKHDHLLLLSITSKSKLWEDETESGGEGGSLRPLGDPRGDVGRLGPLIGSSARPSFAGWGTTAEETIFNI